MAKILWTDPSIEDLRQIFEHIEMDSPTYAERFCTQLVEAPRPLEEFPRMGRIVPEYQDDRIRELIIAPYRLIYVFRQNQNVCEIVAIVHGRRDLLHLDVKEDWLIE